MPDWHILLVAQLRFVCSNAEFLYHSSNPGRVISTTSDVVRTIGCLQLTHRIFAHPVFKLFELLIKSL
jgi:hypothetical protein